MHLIWADSNIQLEKISKLDCFIDRVIRQRVVLVVLEGLLIRECNLDILEDLTIRWSMF